MSDPHSRYSHIRTAIHHTPDGKKIPYRLRRFIPPQEDLGTLVDVEVRSGERLDTLSARVYGHSQLFWRVCDASMELEPDNAMRGPGHVQQVIALFTKSST
jgi:hypothetical protein